MNIIVAPYLKDSFYCRPDSTLIRALEEYYLPDYVDSVSVSPVMYVKTLRAGKAVANRFAERYIDSYGFGILIHPTLKEGYFSNRQEYPFIENSLDYTSVIPLMSFPHTDIINAPSHKFEVTLNYKSVIEELKFPSIDNLMNRISNISKYCSLRIGDFITFELSQPYPLNNMIKDSEHIRIIGSVDGERIFNFVIK